VRWCRALFSVHHSNSVNVKEEMIELTCSLHVPGTGLLSKAPPLSSAFFTPTRRRDTDDDNDDDEFFATQASAAKVMHAPTPHVVESESAAVTVKAEPTENASRVKKEKAVEESGTTKCELRSG
jgi:hypothetical protein